MGLLDFLKTDTLKSVDRIIDNVITNDDEKNTAKKELTEVVLDALTKIAEIQGEVIKTEMKGNWLQKSWRPLMMLAFGVILVSKWFGLTNDAIALELEMNLLEIVKIGLGGYVIGRSAEKIATTVTKNIDMPFLKKKNRK
jgi:hypothetical protein